MSQSWPILDNECFADCKISSSGVEYAGNVSFTRSGKGCFQWSRLSSHAASLLDPDRFPDASINDSGSFCRNPDRKPDGPWCFTNDSKDQWEYCEVKSCSGESDIMIFYESTSEVWVGSSQTCVTWSGRGWVGATMRYMGLIQGQWPAHIICMILMYLSWDKCK